MAAVQQPSSILVVITVSPSNSPQSVKPFFDVSVNPEVRYRVMPPADSDQSHLEGCARMSVPVPRYWTSLATSGTPSSRVAAALVSRLALEGDDYGEDRTVEVKQKDLARLTTMSRSAVADGLAALMNLSAIRQGNEPPVRFSGVVSVPDVDRLKDCAFAEVRDRTIQPMMLATSRQQVP